MGYKAKAVRMGLSFVKSTPAGRLVQGVITKIPGLSGLLGGQDKREGKLQELRAAIKAGNWDKVTKMATTSRFVRVRGIANAALRAGASGKGSYKAATQSYVSRKAASNAMPGGAATARSTPPVLRGSRPAPRRRRKAKATTSRRRGRRLKFGSPAWRRKYMKPRGRRRR